MATPSFLAEFLNWLEQVKRYSPHTVAAYGRDLTAMFAFLQTHTGVALTPTTFAALKAADVQAFLAHQLTRNAMAKSSLNRHLSALRTLAHWLQATHGVATAHLTHIRGLKAPAPSPKALNPTQTFQLLETLAPPPTAPHKTPLAQRRNFALTITLYGLGLRISEALNLTRADIQGDVITVTGKGNKQRQVPIPLPVQSALNGWLTATQSAAPTAPLFPNAQGKKLTPRSAQKFIQATRKKLGLPAHLTPHALRHSFATHLLTEGADLRAVQELLGHSQLATTQRYLAADTQRLITVHTKSHPLK